MSESQQCEGRFLTNRTFEDAMLCFPLLWERVIAPRYKDNDPLWRRAYKLGVYENVLVEVPSGAVIKMIKDDEAGTYGHVQVNGVDIHIREGLEVEKTGQVFCANVVVYLLVWEPKGARKRGCARNRKDAYANYALCIDLNSPTSINGAPRRLDILDTTLEENGNRDQRDIVDVENGVFAHLSRPTWNRELSTNVRRNQLVEVRLLDVETADVEVVKNQPYRTRLVVDEDVQPTQDRIEIGRGALAEKVNLAKKRIFFYK